MAQIIDDSNYESSFSSGSDPLFEALVKYATQKVQAPGQTDPLFEVLAQFGQSSGGMSTFSRGESLEDKKRRALELLQQEGLIGFQ